MPDEKNPSDQNLLDKAFVAYQAGSPAASWILGILFSGFLVYVFVAVPHPTTTQCGLLRFFIALTGGLLFFFLVGGVALHGQLKGFSIGAGGGAAIFVLIQFVVNPVPGCTLDVHSGPEWNGGQNLGQLIDTLRSQRAAGAMDIPTIEVAPSDEDRVAHFDPKLDRVTGDTWSEVFQRICDSTSKCLVCEISRDHKVVKLSSTGVWSKNAAAKDPNRYTYSCK